MRVGNDVGAVLTPAWDCVSITGPHKLTYEGG